jgi:hypothetical protein
MSLASAVNSLDERYNTGGAVYGSCVFKYTEPNSGTDYFYAESSGTSMAAPTAAGIIALYLELNPLATPEEIKLLMKNSAIKDSYTTANPDSTKWGYGKINAYGIFEEHFNPTSSVKDESGIFSALYPNPTSSILNIDLSKPMKGIIYSFNGEKQKTLSSIEKSIDVQDLPTGMYFLVLFSEDGKQRKSFKFIKH